MVVISDGAAAAWKDVEAGTDDALACGAKTWSEAPVVLAEFRCIVELFLSSSITIRRA